MSPKTRNFARRICTTRAAGGRHQHDKIWKAMRILRRFAVADLVAVVETAASSTVGTYASLLARTGFLRVLPGPGGRTPAVYQMVRDTGPTAPSIVKRRTFVYDHNTDLEYSLNANP